MNFKIIILMILILSLNNVSGETITKYDTFDYSGESMEEINFISTSSWSIIKVINSIQINDIVEAQGLNYIIYEVPSNYCYNMPLHSDYDTSVTLTIDGDVVGTAIYGYTKSGDESTTFLQLHIWEGELNIGDKTGAKTMMLTTNSLPSLSLWNIPGSKWGARNVKPSSSPEYVYFSCDSGAITSAAGTTTYLTVSNDYIHSYPFSYTSTDTINLLEMDRDISNTTKVYITVNGYELENETTLKTTDLEVVSYDKVNYTWEVDMYNMYDDVDHKTLLFSMPDELDYEPMLYTDKIVYNSSEIIAVTWEHINIFYDEEIKWGTRKPFEMHIVYYDYNTQRYEAKYQEWLLNTLEDETLYLDSSLFTPQQNYKVIITSSDGDFHKENTWLLSYDFDVIPDNEYLSLSCNAPNCYTYTNSEIDIFYKINNDSTIKVYDDNNNLVHAWYNIIGSGYKTYTIPSDINQLNTYPNWKVYLNNTGYSTSYDAELLVYYSTMVTPTPTPTPIIDEPINESVEDMITELKDESKPIFDLIYGLSTIIVDNPDYDDSGIIDEYEINNWINNLVPLLIVFFLFVMYLGLKKENRGDKP